MADHPPPSAFVTRGVLSLYDNIEDPNDPNPGPTTTAAPVVSKQEQEASADSKKPTNPALLFQPQIRRPPPKQAKGNKASLAPKVIPKPAPVAGNASTDAAATLAAPAKTSLADWAATEEDEWMYGTGEKPQRGGRKNKKKRQQQQSQLETNWDELYDAGKPTVLDEYNKSDETVNEAIEWNELLRRHGRAGSFSDTSSDDEEGTRQMPHQFAPPTVDAFAPPPLSPPNYPMKDQSGEDALARRTAITSAQNSLPPSLSPSPPPFVAPSPPPPSRAAPSLPPLRETAPSPPHDSTVISRAPVRYTQQQAYAGDGEERRGYSQAPASGFTTETDGPPPRSKRPGQAGFAHRLMSKYGWTKGSGLGADESGIINPLRVQAEKRRKKADADGGGWAEPANKGKILGGKRKEEEGKFGKMSEVIVLRNMLENMPNLEYEISEGLGQEIGEECGEKYGRVERLYIDQQARQVFIKFTDQVSALRAVNELDGRIFNGNTILPKFYDVDKFEQGNFSAK